TVTGWTPGTTRKRTRPIAATPPRVATRTSSLVESTLDSNQVAALTISAPATSSNASPESCGERAVQTAAATAQTIAMAPTSLGNQDLFPHRAQRDDAVGDRG